MTEASTGFGRAVAARGPASAVRAVSQVGGGVRLFLVGADALARAGIRALLEEQGGICVVGDDEPGPRALAALRAHGPDVLVVHGMTDWGAAEGLLREVDSGIRVLTVGGPAEGAEWGGAGGSSLHGRLPGSTTAPQLAAAVALAAAGYAVVPGPLTPVAADGAPVRCAVGGGPGSVSDVPPEQLTERECQVVDLVSRGLSNGEIARSLTLSEHTVKTHVQNLLQKLRLRNRVHVAIYAFEVGLR